MFDNFIEAEDLNSNCAFCGRPKFAVVSTFKAGKKPTYSLERCKDDTCKKHCEWNHSYNVQLEEHSEDTVAIASGWGMH